MNLFSETNFTGHSFIPKLYCLISPVPLIYFVIPLYNPDSCARTFPLKCQGYGCLLACFLLLFSLLVVLIGHTENIFRWHSKRDISFSLSLFLRARNTSDRRLIWMTPKYTCIQKGWNTQMPKSMTSRLSFVASSFAPLNDVFLLSDLSSYSGRYKPYR